MRMTRVNLVTITAVFVALGGLIAGIASLGTVAGYTSTGTLRAKLVNQDPASAMVAFQRAMQMTLSRGSLAELIQRPSLDLYRAERAKDPLEDVIQRMRHDIAIRNQSAGAGGAFVSVSFRHPDPALAQRTNAALMERLRSEIVAQVPVEVIRQAGPGEAVMAGKRWQMIATGMLTGLVLGIAGGALLSMVRNRQRWSLRRIGGFAAAGTLLGLTVALLIPNVFISNAVLRTSRPVDREVLNRTVLSDENLGEIIRAEGLYTRELESQPLVSVARRMRDEYIQVRGVDVAPPFQTQPAQAYMISFRDHDRAKAQSVTHALVTNWIKTGLVTQVTTEVLDPASDPTAPSSPNRMQIALAGTLIGLLVGLAASRFGQSSAQLVPEAPGRS